MVCWKLVCLTFILSLLHKSIPLKALIFWSGSSTFNLVKCEQTCRNVGFVDLRLQSTTLLSEASQLVCFEPWKEQCKFRTVATWPYICLRQVPIYLPQIGLRCFPDPLTSTSSVTVIQTARGLRAGATALWKSGGFLVGRCVAGGEWESCTTGAARYLWLNVGRVFSEWLFFNVLYWVLPFQEVEVCYTSKLYRFRMIQQIPPCKCMWF